MNPSRTEDRLNGTIDRNRDKAATSSRTVRVRYEAQTAVNRFVTSLAEEDRAEAMNAAIRHLRTLYGAGEGEREAVSLFGSLAWSAALQTRRVVARATAEQELAKIIAANDGEAE